MTDHIVDAKILTVEEVEEIRKRADATLEHFGGQGIVVNFFLLDAPLLIESHEELRRKYEEAMEMLAQITSSLIVHSADCVAQDEELCICEVGKARAAVKAWREEKK